MTRSARKPRSDSVDELARIVQGAQKEIAPPSHVPLEAAAWPFWHSVVEEFARADWTEHNLELAAMLARCMSSLEENQRLLIKEGFVYEKEIKDDKGKVRKVMSVENARARSVQALTAQVLNIRRSLALNAKAKAGSSGAAAEQREANKATEQRAGKGKDLLA